MPRLKIGLALGGGAARGLAHLGVLEVLEEAGLRFDLVAGTSMGALVGAMYCADASIRRAKQGAMEFLRSPDFANAAIHRLRREHEPTEPGFWQSFGQYIARGRVIASTVTRPSVLDIEELYELLGFFVNDRDMEELNVPLGIVVTDLEAGEEVVLRRGPLIDAVAASSAVPGAFPPIDFEGRRCMDGGVVNMVPVSAAFQMGADYVIAVDVVHELPLPGESMKALHIHFRSHQITKRHLTSHQLRFADWIISPQVGHLHWADFSRFEECVEAGVQAAKEVVDGIAGDIKRLRRTPAFLRRGGARLFQKVMGKEKV